MRARLPQWRISVAAGIVIASVISALFAWQASRAGELSGNTDEDTRQNTVTAETLRLQDTSTIVSDLRTFGRYEDAVLSARVRELAADRIARRDPAAARACASRPTATGPRPKAPVPRCSSRCRAPTRRRATPASTSEQTRAILDRFTDPRIRQLRPDALRAQARSAGIRSEQLTALAALAIGATFLLALAEIVSGQASRRLAGAGASVLVVSLILFALV